MVKNKKLRWLTLNFIPYTESWLKHRKRGLVIMPANKSNEGYNHSNVIRYDGSKSNLAEVEKAMEKVKLRRPYEELDI